MAGRHQSARGSRISPVHDRGEPGLDGHYRPEGKVTDANRATVRLTGVPREGIIGTSFSDCFTDPQEAEEIHQPVLAEGWLRTTR